MIRARKDETPDQGFIFITKIKEYALKDKVITTGDGEDDFVVVKVPYVVDSYDQSEVIQARTEGCELKSICRRLEKGEILPVDRSSEYGDNRGIPQTTAERLELAKKTEAIIEAAHLENFTKEQLKELAALQNMTPAQIKGYVDNIIKQEAEKKAKPIPPKAEPAPVPPALDKGGNENA